jgi:hypothetical protein
VRDQGVDGYPAARNERERGQDAALAGPGQPDNAATVVDLDISQ